ncbi:MAG: hypothetical protein HY238_11315, partial [Acidobacteria bacterium]|nr:hypothetical protein [Acidobacteriota bacterium]
GLLAVQFVLLHKNPQRDLYKPFALTNTAAAGITSATALRNYGLPRMR